MTPVERQNQGVRVSAYRNVDGGALGFAPREALAFFDEDGNRHEIDLGVTRVVHALVDQALRFAAIGSTIRRGPSLMREP
jgi:hypothetical protein